MQVERKEHHGYYYHVATSGRVILGFTETGFPIELFPQLFPGVGVKSLKQVHGNTILLSSQIRPDSQGDGIILDETDTLAIIKTADCVPLFFWDEAFSTGGIIHIGWQGLYQAIEKNLIIALGLKKVSLKSIRFFLGPAIEQRCYEVDQARFNSFKEKSYQNKIFKSSGRGKFQMDIPGGIIHSLGEQGISKRRASRSNLCTYCDRAFPSFRRDRQTGQRIYNFILLKNVLTGE